MSDEQNDQLEKALQRLRSLREGRRSGGPPIVRATTTSGSASRQARPMPNEPSALASPANRPPNVSPDAIHVEGPNLGHVDTGHCRACGMAMPRDLLECSRCGASRSAETSATPTATRHVVPPSSSLAPTGHTAAVAPIATAPTVPRSGSQAPVPSQSTPPPPAAPSTPVQTISPATIESPPAAPKAKTQFPAPGAQAPPLTCLTCGMRITADTANCPRCDASTNRPVPATLSRPQGPVQPPIQVGVRQTCPSCGLIQSGNSKFCTICGTLVVNASANSKPPPSTTTAPPNQDFLTCSSCGMKQRTSQRFCPNCGNATGTSSMEPSAAPAFCTQCGRRRTETAKFCTSCGSLFSY